MSVGFAVEAAPAKSTSRWWYALGGALAAPFAVTYLVIDELLPGVLALEDLPWFTYWLLLLGAVVGGIILGVTANKRFRQRPRT